MKEAYPTPGEFDTYFTVTRFGDLPAIEAENRHAALLGMVGGGLYPHKIQWYAWWKDWQDVSRFTYYAVNEAKEVGPLLKFIEHWRDKAGPDAMEIALELRPEIAVALLTQRAK